VELSRAHSPLAAIAPTRDHSGRLTVANGADHSESHIRSFLYIEDNLSNLKLVEEVLREGPQTKLLTATKGRFGLHLARQYLPDLILLDLHLPDLQGWDVLAELQADPATRSIPVIVVSADATPGQIKRLLSAGARAYLTKPLDIEEFFRVTRELLASENSELTTEPLEAAANV
jgi:CheY-like chemotaxis protein